jgi:hypothetical protein
MQRPVAGIPWGLLACALGVVLCGCTNETSTSSSAEPASSSPLASKIHHALQQEKDWRTLVDPGLAQVLAQTQTDPLAALDEIVGHQQALTQLAERAADRLAARGMKDVQANDVDFLLEHDENFAAAREEILRRLRWQLLARTHVDAF